GRLVVRHREQDRPAGGRQRAEPDRQGAGAALRLPRHRRDHRVVGREGRRDHGQRRGAGQGGARRVQGEARQAQPEPEDPRRGRAAAVGSRDQDQRGPQGGDQPGAGQEGRQADPRRGAEGRQGPGPGRRAAGLLEEPRRPADGDRPGQGAGLRLRGAVHQLPV
ncbi:MAG: UPF0234 protein Yitk, partial [uncultured Nocardioidaceae bacterium]